MSTVSSAFFQHEMSQEDDDSIVHEDDISLSITELPPEYHCGDSLTMDITNNDYKRELDLEGCLPRYLLQHLNI